MIRLVQELAADGFPVAVTCRALDVAPSTYYEATSRAPSARELEDRDLLGLIVEVHQDSRGTYGAPRVHAELRMGLGLKVGRKRVARLMRGAGIHGVSHRRKRRHRPDTTSCNDGSPPMAPTGSGSATSRSVNRHGSSAGPMWAAARG